MCRASKDNAAHRAKLVDLSKQLNNELQRLRGVSVALSQLSEACQEQEQPSLKAIALVCSGAAFVPCPVFRELEMALTQARQ